MSVFRLKCWLFVKYDQCSTSDIFTNYMFVWSTMEISVSVFHLNKSHLIKTTLRIIKEVKCDNYFETVKNVIAFKGMCILYLLAPTSNSLQCIPF